MLTRALIDAGRAQEALDVAAAPKDTSPAALALWHARAEAAQAVADHSAAAEAWQLLCTARPDDWRAWANYGDALAGLERWEEAAQALRRAWTLNPTELPIQQNFTAALTKAGFQAEAVDQLRHMLDSGADDAGTRLMLSRLLADLGRPEEFDGRARQGGPARRRRRRDGGGQQRTSSGSRCPTELRNPGRRRPTRCGRCASWRCCSSAPTGWTRCGPCSRMPKRSGSRASSSATRPQRSPCATVMRPRRSVCSSWRVARPTRCAGTG